MKARALVLDGLGPNRKRRAQIESELAQLATDALRIEYLERIARELNGPGADRDPLTAEWCFQRADKLIAARKGE